MGSDGRPVAVFQLMRSKRMGLSLWSHPAFNQNCAFLMTERANNPSKRIGEAKRVHTAIADHLAAQGGVITIAFPSSVRDMQPYIWKGFKVVPHYTYRIALGPGIEAVRAGYSTETRNSVRKAVADGVVVRVAVRAEVLPLVRATFLRNEKVIDHRKVEAVLAAFPGDKGSLTLIAERAGKPIAAAFCVFDRHSAYYLLGGHVKEGGHPGAGALVIDRCIVGAIERGVQLFDLEGSMLPDVERFFRGFGGSLVPYFTINRASFPVEVLLKSSWRHQF
ncbi:MAG: GNAT family N-acetyltransferase [Flavobacteriales bacterium]|nr:GNAT family N-acetyltransferase [Flavobacteriales bacterium]